MMRPQLFLGLSAALWLLYGAYCFLSPDSLAAAAGVVATTPTGTAELRAMYGGLQMAIGVLAALGMARSGLTHPALMALALLTVGLGATRLLAVLVGGGWSAYTLMALGVEFGSALWAMALLRGARG